MDQAANLGQDAEADLSGQVLDDFRLLRRLGQGGMGQVYLAEQLSLRRQVAVKLLKPELAVNATSLARFRAEAEAVARATHANIVQIYTISQAGGFNYMALEYVEGRNLREFVEKKKPVTVASGLKIMAQVAAALQRAGELNIVHRDIKPENILLSRKGEVKVADFGLSRCFDRPQNLTQTGVAMGTPLYMSPEQVEPKGPPDHRSDLYSFGATCYFLFAAQPPFRGESPLEVAYQHVHKEPEPLASLRPDLSADLCAIIHKLLAKPPEARYQTAREVVREVTRLREQLLVTSSLAALTQSSPNVLTSPALSPAEVATTAVPLTDSPPRRRSAWRPLAALAVLLALVGGLAVGWSRHQPEPSPAAEVKAPPGPAPDDPGAGPARAALAAKEREKELQRLVRDNLKPQGPLNIEALKAAVNLGRLYLNERRLDDAEQFFKEIGSAGPKGNHGRLLSQLGRAAVFAYRDDAAESNEQFLAIQAHAEKLDKLPGQPGPKATPAAKKEWNAHAGEVEAYNFLWKNASLAPTVREMVAEALHRNFANDPKGFPAKLDPWLRPPPPLIKPPPAS
jgi:serine/threonine-protein kinase